MDIVPAGKFEVKLEFEDDSFELTYAEIKSDGTFSCESKRALAGKPFKMFFVSDDDLFYQYQCKIEDQSGSLIHGKLSGLSFR